MYFSRATAISVFKLVEKTENLRKAEKNERKRAILAGVFIAVIKRCDQNQLG